MNETGALAERRLRWLHGVRVASLCLLLATLAVIWGLTTQPPSDSISLSDLLAFPLQGALSLDHVAASYLARKIAHTLEFFPVGLFAALWVFARLPREAQVNGEKKGRASAAASEGPRASAVEGAGASADTGAGGAASAPSGGGADEAANARRWHALGLVAFCLLCSLGDQTHKLFVPTRHFDVLDLPFDALGYLLGIALARLLARWLVGRLARFDGKAMGR